MQAELTALLRFSKRVLHVLFAPTGERSRKAYSGRELQWIRVGLRRIRASPHAHKNQMRKMAMIVTPRKNQTKPSHPPSALPNGRSNRKIAKGTITLIEKAQPTTRASFPARRSRMRDRISARVQ